MSKVSSLAEAVALVRDGSTLAVCGAGGVQEPDLLLSGLAERFDRTGSPNNLTEFHPIRTGEVDGRGTSVFGRKGFVRKMIGGSFWPVGVLELTRLINANEMEAYNYPIGILYGLLEATAAGRPGIVTKIGLGTYVDPEQGGGALNSISTNILVSRIEVLGETYLFYRAQPVDAAFIRGTTADEDGNLTMEEEPAMCGPLVMAQAARSSGGKVIAQVRRIVPRGTLDPHMVRVPGILVDAVVVHPEQWQTTRHRYQPSAVGRERLDLATIPARPMDDAKVVLRRSMMEVRDGETIAIGFGLPGYLPAIALEEGIFDRITFTIEHGPIGGINGLAAGGATFPMTHNPQAILDAADQLRMYAGGGIDRAYLGIGEVDGAGNVNVGKFGDRIPGTGGFIEITQGFRNVVFCCVLGDKGRRKVVDRIQQVSFNGRQAFENGQTVRYVMEKAVFGLGRDGLVVEEVAPGLDLRRDLLDQIGASVQVSPDLKTMPAALFRPEPMGLGSLWDGAATIRPASGSAY